MTLSRFLRDYLYIPLGGNRGSTYHRYRNLLLTMLLGGLWHGAGWNFITWGVIHGIVVVLSSRWRSTSLQVGDVPLGSILNASFPVALLRCIAVIAVSAIAWVFFRVQSPAEAWSIIGKMLFSLSSFECSLETESSLDILSRVFPVFLTIEFCTRHLHHPLQRVVDWPQPVRWLIYAGFIWGTMYYMPNETGEFVYFQF